MEILSAVGLIISPFLITGLTNLVKKIQKIELSEYRASWLRVTVAVLSFLAVVLSAALNKTQVDPSVIQVLSEAIIVFIGSTGVHYWNKYRKLKEASVVE